MKAKTLALAVCVGGMAVAGARTAPAAEPAQPSPSPTYVKPPTQLNPAILASGVAITKVESIVDPTSHLANMQVTITNFDAADQDVVLHQDPRQGTPLERTVHVKGHDKVLQKLLLNNVELCKTTQTLDLMLTGGKTDNKTHTVTRPAPTFVVVSANLIPIPGVQPPDDIIAKQARLLKVSVEDGYVCGKPLKVKVSVRNGSGIVPQHLALRLFDAPMIGAPAYMGLNGGVNNGGVILLTAPVSIGGSESKDVLLTTPTPVVGHAGSLSVKLYDDSTELGNHVGTHWAEIVVAENNAVWKID